MNADNKSKAVVVYASPKQKRFNFIHTYSERINLILCNYFNKRRKFLFSSLIVFSLFFMAGNCFAAHYLYKLPYILDVFFDKYFIKAFLIAYPIIFASGYTIFGSVLSVCFFASFSFFLGNFVYCRFSSIHFDFAFVFFLTLVITVIFFISVFYCETSVYYSKNRFANKIIFSRSSAIYSIFSLTIFFILFIFLTLLKNYFW